MCLLAGVAAGFDFLTILTGDASCANAPWTGCQVLREMGAKVDGRTWTFPGHQRHPQAHLITHPSGPSQSAILLASYTLGRQGPEPWLTGPYGTDDELLWHSHRKT